VGKLWANFPGVSKSESSTIFMYAQKADAETGIKQSGSKRERKCRRESTGHAINQERKCVGNAVFFNC